jgi:hypothetical protein
MKITLDILGISLFIAGLMFIYYLLTDVQPWWVR